MSDIAQITFSLPHLLYISSFNMNISHISIDLHLFNYWTDKRKSVENAEAKKKKDHISDTKEQIPPLKLFYSEIYIISSFSSSFPAFLILFLL